MAFKLFTCTSPTFLLELSAMFRQRILLSVFVALLMFSGVLPLSTANASKPTSDEITDARRFVAAKFMAPKATAQKPGLIVAVNNGAVEKNSHYDKPLKIVDKEFTRGIACHATSKVVVQLPSPGKKLLAQIGPHLGLGDT